MIVSVTGAVNILVDKYMAIVGNSLRLMAKIIDLFNANNSLDQTSCTYRIQICVSEVPSFRFVPKYPHYAYTRNESCWDDFSGVK